MTLTKAVEAAREALDLSAKRIHMGAYSLAPILDADIIEALNNASDSLPDQPLTEDQIIKIMYDGIPKHWQSPTALSCMKHGMIALIRANVLFMAEEKS